MLTKRISNLAPSKTMQVTAKSKNMKAQGIKVLDYSVGEPDFQTPENICEAAKAAIDAGYTKYTLVNGITPLREAISEKLWKDNKVRYTPDQICVGTGAKQPLFNAVFSVCEEGDEVIIPTPAWVSYEEIVKLAGATPVYVECYKKDDFELNMEGVKKAVTPRTKAIIINTPNNPTGAVYSEETLRELAALAVEHNFYIIVDEIYEKLIFGDKKHFSVASISDEVWNRCILINGFSKSYAMTGWRIGYVAANDEIIKAVKGVQSHMTSAGNTISQYAALEALKGSQEFIKEMHKEFEERRDYLVKRINETPYLSCNNVSGAFYVMIDISQVIGKKCGDTVITDSMVLADLLLTKAHLALVSGAAFHAEGYLRMCYAVSRKELEEGMDCMKKFMEELD